MLKGTAAASSAAVVAGSSAAAAVSTSDNSASANSTAAAAAAAATTTAAAASCFSMKHINKLQAPRCPREPFTTVDGRAAPFFWMRNKKEQAARYCDAETKYSQTVLGTGGGLGASQQVLLTEMKARDPPTSSWIPYARGGFAYWFAEEHEDTAHGAYFRRRLSADPDFIEKCIVAEQQGRHLEGMRALPGTEVIIDIDETARNEKLEFVCLGEYHISPDERRVVISLDMSDGREVFSLVVLEFPEPQQQQPQQQQQQQQPGKKKGKKAAPSGSDGAAAAAAAAAASSAASGSQKKKRLLRINGDEAVDARRLGAEVAWINNSSFIYTRLDKTLRPYQVWRCDLVEEGAAEPADAGSQQQELQSNATSALRWRETLIYQEEDDLYTICGLERSDDDAIVSFCTESKTASEMWYIATSGPADAKWRCVLPRRVGEYTAFHHRSLFLPKHLFSSTASSASAARQKAPAADKNSGAASAAGEEPEPKSSASAPDAGTDVEWASQPAWLIMHNCGDHARDFQVDVALSDVGKQQQPQDAEKKASSPSSSSPSSAASAAAAAAAAAHHYDRETEAAITSPSKQLKPFISFDHRYAVEGITTFRDFIQVDVRFGGFPQLLLLSNQDRSTLFADMAAAAAAAAAADTAASSTSAEPAATPSDATPVSAAPAVPAQEVQPAADQTQTTAVAVVPLADVESSNGSTLSQMEAAAAAAAAVAAVAVAADAQQPSNGAADSSSAPVQQAAGQEDGGEDDLRALLAFRPGLFRFGNDNDFVRVACPDDLPRQYSAWVLRVEWLKKRKHSKSATARAPALAPSSGGNKKKKHQQQHQQQRKRSSSTSSATTSQLDAAAASDPPSIIGYETDPEMLRTLALLSAVCGEGTNNFDDSFFRASISSPLLPHSEFIVDVTPSLPAPTVSMRLLKFWTVPHSAKGVIYDPSLYGVHLDYVETTTSVPAAAAVVDSTATTATATTESEMPVFVPVVLKFRKQLCEKYLQNQAVKQLKARMERQLQIKAAAAQQRLLEDGDGEDNNSKNNDNGEQEDEQMDTVDIVLPTVPAIAGNPTVLYGYAAYGDSIELDFDATHLSLLDRGVVMADCAPRGGGELGRRWYFDGKMERKENTFFDFIAVSEWLVQPQGWAHRDRLAIRGASAGGLLVGAVTHLRPDLYKAVSANCPFVDAITTMMDKSIPLTAAEQLEWGNPTLLADDDPTADDVSRRTNAAVRNAMLRYSPVDLVTDGEASGRSRQTVFPNMFIEFGLEDARVQFFEPASWTALLRDNWHASAAAGRVLLMHCNMEAGHEGGSSRFDGQKELAREYCFLLGALGVQVKRPL